MSPAPKKKRGDVQPHGQIRQSQVVTQFGPGAMMEFSVLDTDCRPVGDQGLLVPYAQAQPVSAQAPAAITKPAATKQTRRGGQTQKRQPQGAAGN